jgi:DNA-binding transcriptional MerR regulator
VRIRLYVDEDAPRLALLQALRSRGIDVIAAQDIGMRQRDDEEHLTFATVQVRALYGFNVGDYFHLHTEFLTEGREHAGIVLAKQQHYSVGEQMRRLLKLIGTKAAEEMRNQIEFLSDWGE